jgi:hypothetical protein
MTLFEVVELLGNIGEFLGAIGVVVTLGYLVVQIRQNTRMLSSTIYGSWVASAANTLEMLATHADRLGPIYDDSSRSVGDLTSAERRIHSAYFVNTMNVYEASYLNYLDGTLPRTMYEAKIRNLIRIFRSTPLHRESWDRGASELFDSRFVSFVEREVFPKATRSL